MNEKIRILIVDDSAFMRKSLSIMLNSDDDIEIVGTARDGMEAVALAKSLHPDLITMDIEMPRMDGLSALKIIMKEAPTSVIMVSSLTSEGAESTLKALELGAVDFIPKEMSFVSVNISEIKADLIKKVKTICRQTQLHKRLRKISGITGRFAKPLPKKNVTGLPINNYRAVAIGISTGGPLSLQKVIPQLSKDIRVPIFIVQHMPPKFTKSLADRLNNMSEINVKEAQDNEEVKGGTVYIARGGYHLNLKKTGIGKAAININPKPDNTLHRPSVDVMLDSVVSVYGKQTLAVIMTGMGHDGSEAIQRLKNMGGYCLAQDEDSCVVYGMPKSVVDAGNADVVAPLERIPQIINKAV